MTRAHRFFALEPLSAVSSGRSASAFHAQGNVCNGGGLNLDVRISAGVLCGPTRNTYFGAGGNFGYTSVNGSRADVTWEEGYV
jgi:hypothetical protein